MILGDCLEVMPSLSPSHFNMTFADLPFGCTDNVWDTRIDLSLLWLQLTRINTVSSALVFSSTMPFSATLALSNLEQFRYDLIWQKSRATGFLHAKKRPLRNHESILVFYRKPPTYNPQMAQAEKKQGNTVRLFGNTSKNWALGGKYRNPSHAWKETGLRYPVSIIKAPSSKPQQSRHPTQKPVTLLAWLIRTFSNPGNAVLDPASGSGTTAISALSTERSVVCIERDPTYFDASVERIRKHVTDNKIDATIEVRR